jgi:hypothetical protein
LSAGRVCQLSAGRVCVCQLGTEPGQRPLWAVHAGRSAGAARGVAVEGGLLVSAWDDGAVRLWELDPALDRARPPQPAAA